jgi:chemotaxis protein MotB
MAKKHGHHGGAWKVAYADFTTAMMALFLCLWLTSQDQRIKDAVERAFRNPFTSITKESTGIIPNKDTQAVKSDKGNFDSASAVELKMLRRIVQDLSTSLHSGQDNDIAQSVQLDLSSEGLRIHVFDRSQKSIFEPESFRFTSYGKWVFTTLAWEIARYNTLLVDLEGHTEKGHRPKNPDYGVWELSADRANAARRLMLEYGVKDLQIRKVAGLADTSPLPDRLPENECNSRVTVLLKVRTTSPTL